LNELARIKKEVKEWCLKLINSEVGSKEFREAKKILKEKYKFTSFSLLALFYDPPVIEFTDEQIGLIFEDE